MFVFVQIVADAIRQEKLAERKTEDGIQCDFDTDDDDSEAAYDTWKLRELTRLKRDREERDQYVDDVLKEIDMKLNDLDVNVNNKNSNVGII